MKCSSKLTTTATLKRAPATITNNERRTLDELLSFLFFTLLKVKLTFFLTLKPLSGPSRNAQSFQSRKKTKLKTYFFTISPSSPSPSPIFGVATFVLRSPLLNAHLKSSSPTRNNNLSYCR